MDKIVFHRRQNASAYGTPDPLLGFCPGPHLGTFEFRLHIPACDPAAKISEIQHCCQSPNTSVNRVVLVFPYCEPVARGYALRWDGSTSPTKFSFMSPI